jgi:hypothetical protein
MKITQMDEKKEGWKIAAKKIFEPRLLGSFFFERDTQDKKLRAIKSEQGNITIIKLDFVERKSVGQYPKRIVIAYFNKFCLSWNEMGAIQKYSRSILNYTGFLLEFQFKRNKRF